MTEQVQQNSGLIEALHSSGYIVALSFHGWGGAKKVRSSSLLSAEEKEALGLVAQLIPKDHARRIQRHASDLYGAKMRHCLPFGPIGWYCPATKVDQLRADVAAVQDALAKTVAELDVLWPKARINVMHSLNQAGNKMGAEGLGSRMAVSIPDSLHGLYRVELVLMPMPTLDGVALSAEDQARFSEAVQKAAEDVVLGLRVQLSDALEQLTGRLKDGPVTMRTVNAQKRFVERLRSHNVLMSDHALRDALKTYEDLLDDRVTDEKLLPGVLGSLNGLGKDALGLSADKAGVSSIVASFGQLGRRVG